MIAFQKNRPVLQVGPCQVADYDLSWLEEAVERAAKAADFANFPMTAEVCQGVEFYLEQKCSLRLLQLEDLFARLKKLLVQVGCEPIAEHLRPLAPPITLSLVPSATLAGHGFELAFFEHLRESLTSLSKVGTEEIEITGMRKAVMILTGREKWHRSCDALLREIESFIAEMKSSAALCVSLDH